MPPALKKSSAATIQAQSLQLACAECKASYLIHLVMSFDICADRSLAPQTQGNHFSRFISLQFLMNPASTSARKRSPVTRAPVAAANRYVRMDL